MSKTSDTRFLVRATFEEMTGIWYRWPHIWGLEMVQDYQGYLTQIGEIAGRPICANVFWYEVLGERVAFVDCTSQLADYKMLEEWIVREFTSMTDQCDSANFHNVLAAIERFTGRKASLRNHREVDRLLSSVPTVTR